ncbi:MAG: hypothetical protein KDD55_06090 [Bdellovibrionales bacterium]|nr:hypothetical protein [Bdellovibrionales bacterium]
MCAQKPANIANQLGHLLRGIAHDVRTPLSVISNDLQYFATQLPKGECDRSLRRCKEISEHLSALSSILLDPLERKKTSLLTLLNESLGDHWDTSAISSEIFLDTDRVRLGYVLQEIARVTGVQGSKEKQSFIAWEDCCRLIFSFPAKDLSDTLVGASSVTELIESQTNSHFTSPPIADALCFLLQLRIEYKREGERGILILSFL